MNKKLYVGVTAAAACCLAFALTACDNNIPDAEAPEKLKDGEAFTLTVGENKQLDLAEYISVPSGYEYVVSSNNEGVLTVAVEEAKATVTAVSHGNAVVTATAGDISITFAATVNAVPPAFDKATVSYDLYTEASKEITLAPKSGESTYSYTYALKTADENVTIAGNKLTVAYAEPTQKTLKVVATYTDSAVTGGASRTVEFDVDVNVTDTAPAAPVFDDAELAYDLRTATAANKEITLAPKSGADTYRYTYALKTADENVTIAGNKLTAAYDEPTQKTLIVVATYTDSANEAARPRTVEFDVDVNVTDTTPRVKSQTFEKTIDLNGLSSDVYDPEEGTLKIDLAENIANPGNLALSYLAHIVGGEDDQDVSADEGSSVVDLHVEGAPYEGFTEELEITVTGDGINLSYLYKLTVRDSGAPMYIVSNGGFDNDFEGWTRSSESFGEISEASTYWSQNFPMHNDGKYFKTSGTGTLATPLFTVGGINKISFKLGSGGKDGCYVALEKEDGTVVAIWRNYKFADTGAENGDKVGTEKFIENFVTYIADLSDYSEQKVRIVIHDEEAEDGGFGILNFDSLVTYYENEEDLPTADKQDGRPVFDAVNELANKSDLQAAVDGAITEQGDYTTESFNAYRQAIEAAEAVLANPIAKQAAVDAALEAINAATLVAREPIAKDTDKNVVIVVDGSREISIADYVDENGLSSIAYEVNAGDTTYVEVSAITNGKFTITAKETVTPTGTPANVELKVLYKSAEKLSIDLQVSVIADPTPTLTHETVTQNIDLFTATNKENLVIDFANNVVNPADQELSFTVTQNGTAVEGVAADGKYTFTYGKYTDTATVVVFNVSVGYTQSTEGTLTYTYTLSLTDTTAYRVKNGGFENDLDDWTKVGRIGNVSTETNYWVGDQDKAEGFEFGMDGEKMFSAYAPDNEERAYGTLTSSEFTVGGSGFITYKLGGAKNPEKVRLEVIDENGVVLDAFYNQLWQNGSGANKTGCALTAYKANILTHKGKKVRVRIVDTAAVDYGLFFFDSLETYHATEPTEGFNLATSVLDSVPQITEQVANGGFETGNLDGWELSGDIGVVTGDEQYWTHNGGTPESYGRDGSYLFSWWTKKEDGSEHNRENQKGILVSSLFTLKAGQNVSFKFGGGKIDGNVNTNIYIEFVDFETDTVLAKFYNTSANNGQLIQYSYAFDTTSDKTCYIRVVDDAENGWGCLTVDSFFTSGDDVVTNGVKAENQLQNQTND